LAVVVGRLFNSISKSGQQHPVKNRAISADSRAIFEKNPFHGHDLGFFLKFSKSSQGICFEEGNAVSSPSFRRKS